MILNNAVKYCTVYVFKAQQTIIKTIIKMDFKVKVLIEHFLFFEYILLRF